MPNKSKLRKEMGERLRAFRLRILKIETQTNMGKLLGGMIQAVYNTYEQGTRSVPDDLKVKLHYEFGLNLNWFLTGIGNPTVIGEEEIKSSGKKKSNTTKLYVGKVKKAISEMLKDVDKKTTKRE